MNICQFCKRSVLTSPFWFALNIIPSLAVADATLALSETDFLTELPVVLSATRLSQSLENVPVAMTVIDNKTIEASGAMTIPDVLRLVPGVQVGTVSSTKLTVTYHGLSDRYARDMQVLVDGRSVYDAGFGGVTWSDLPLLIEDIQRIEVIRGPNSAAFGANAFAATINIVTFHPAEQPNALLKVTTGSFSTQQKIGRYAASIGHFDFRLSVMSKQSEGLDGRYDDSDKESVSFRGDYHLSAHRDLQIETGYTRGRLDDEGYVVDDIYQPERSINHHTDFQQLRLSQILSAEQEVSLQFYHNYQNIDDDFETVLFSEALSQETGSEVTPAMVQALLGWPDQRLTLGYGLSSERYDLELQHISRLSPDLRLVWGIGGRRDSAWGRAMFGDDQVKQRDQARAFFNAEWYATQSTVLNLGLMAEAYEHYTPYYSPRIAANFHIDSRQSMRLSYTKAIRMPTLVENHSSIQARMQDGDIFDVLETAPAERLRPERISSFEFGYVTRFPAQRAMLDLKIYQDEIKDFIRNPRNENCFEAAAYCAHPVPLIAEHVTGAEYYANVGDLKTSGFEIGFSAEPTRHTLLRIGYANAVISGRVLDKIYADGSDPAVRHAKVDTDLVPFHTYSLLLAHQLPHQIKASIGYYRVDDMLWMGEGDYIKGYDKYDMKITHTADYGRGVEGKISLIFKNMGDRYIDFQYINEIEPETYIEYELIFD